MRLVTLVLCVAASGCVLAACGREAPPESRPAAPAEPPLGPKVFPLEAADVLHDAGRDEWQRPDVVVDALRIAPGERIADVGCGTGYFTMRLAHATGDGGHVLAVDIQQGMLDILATRLDARSRKIVELRRSRPEQPLRPGDAIDLAFCANTLHEVDDPGPFVQSLADGLAPGGRLAFVNWLPRRMRIGPPLEHRIAPARVTALALAAGLVPDRDEDLLPLHSFQVFRKPE